MQKEKLFSEKKHILQLPLNLKKEEMIRFKDWEKKDTYTEVFEYKITNTYVSPFGLLFKNGFLVKEALYEMYANTANSLTFYKKILTNKVKTINDTCIVFHHAWYENYYHWYTECLPRLFALKKYHKNSVLILPEDLKRFHHETIAFFEFKDIIYCKMTEVIKCKELIFTNFTTKGFGNHRSEIIKDMASFFQSKTTKSLSNISNIYTPRSKAPKRNCVNEKDVLAILKEFQFESIVMDDLSQMEQISLFTNAKNIIGVHGSSFVNLMYMKPKGAIFDLIEKNHKDLCYSNLANIFEINYLLIESDGVGNHSDFRDDDIIVDSLNLKKTLNIFLS